MFSGKKSARARTRRQIFSAATLLFSTGLSHAHSGDFDLPFGVAGVANTNLTLGTPNVVVDHTNRKIFAGYDSSYTNAFFGAIDNSGNVDRTFGKAGYVETPLPIVGMVVDSKDRIVVGQRDFSGPTVRFLITRFLSDGSIDVSFGSSGSTIVGYSKDLYLVSLASDPDDSIYVAAQEAVASTGETLMAVAKVDACGAVTSGFGLGGVAEVRILPPGSEQSFSVGMSVDSAGRIAISGASVLPSGLEVESIAMLQSNGLLDPTFGSGRGFIQTSFSSTVPLPIEPTSVLFDREDRLLTSIQVIDPSTSVNSAYISRYLADGTVDIKFNSGDPLLVASPALSSNLIVDERSRILFATSDSMGVSIHRFDNDGSQDHTFGDGSGQQLLTNLLTGYIAMSHGGFIAVSGLSAGGTMKIDQLTGYDLPPIMPPDHF